MSRKPKVAKVEAWAVVSAFSEINVVTAREDHARELMRDFPEKGEMLIRMVPFDHDAARVLKAATDLLEEFSAAADCGATAWMGGEKSWEKFRAAVERRQKRGAK